MTVTVQHLLDRRDVSEQTWRQQRRDGIGGSDAAAVLGLSPYESALSVYYAKVEGVDKKESLAMEIGRELEPFLRRKFEQWIRDTEGCPVQVEEVPFMLGNPDYPFMFANIDGRFTHPELGLCGLELKSTGEFQRSAWEEDEVPDHCYIQVQHYMAVTGLQHFYIAYLIGNRIFSAKRVPRNDKVIETLVEQLEKFWSGHVLQGVPPAPGGLGCDTEILKQLYPAEEGSTIDLSHCQGYYDRYQELKKQEKELKQEVETIRQHFMAEMKEAQTALVGSKKITWKTVERKGYTVAPSSSRVLRIG